MTDTMTDHQLDTDQATREASGAHKYGRYLEEFEVGAVYKHWPAKTITESEDHLFCLLTMNHHPLHLNDVYAEESISDEIGERVRSVLAAAESAATAIRHEAEQQAQSKRRAAETEAHRVLEDARHEADALLEERIKRISELSDSIIEGAE